MCLDQGECHYFLRDQDDGECRGYTGIAAGECKAPYNNSKYMLYQINYEPKNGPGTNGIALLLKAKTLCPMIADILDYGGINDAQSCADNCNKAVGCEFFIYDPNDGECISIATSAPNCPEGTEPHAVYDFYAANGGAGAMEVAEVLEKSNLRMIAEGQGCY